MWLPAPLALNLFRTAALLFSFCVSCSAGASQAKTRWTELNIGPFYVDTDSDPGAAQQLLTNLEQTRWVLGNLLETKDLRGLWPIRILLPKTPPTGGAGQFVSQNGTYLCVLTPDAKAPLAAVAGLLLDDNTPRLPSPVEAGLRQLFSTLEARGSHVTWGGPVPKPDPDFALMQLFATKFEYGASFHIFLTALRGGSTLTAAERNAFGKPAAELQSEANANLAGNRFAAVPVSGRPLDPKRDFGQHTFDETVANAYLAEYALPANREAARSTFRTAIAEGGPAAALGNEGLAQMAELENGNAQRFWQAAIDAGSHNPVAYVGSSEDRSPSEQLRLLKQAALLNERWSEPVYRQVALAETPAEKELLLKTVVKLDPRNTDRWIELAKLQTVSGEGTPAQGSWLRAEDSAATDAERDRVHELRLSYEQQRLDAAEAARRQDRDAVHRADQEAQQAEAERIHAAEAKANGALDSAAGNQKAGDAVDWKSLAGEKKLKGTLTRTECLRSGWRLSVRDNTGRSLQLFLSKDSGADLSCSPTAPQARRITLQYRPAPDEELHTAGEITNLLLQ